MHLTAALSDDDRLLLRYKDYLKIEDDAFEQIGSYRIEVWVYLAGIISDDLHWSDLRSTVIISAHIHCAFFYWRVWRKLTDYPWKLALGDIHSNLENLKSTVPNTNDMTTRKIYDLLVNVV